MDLDFESNCWLKLGEREAGGAAPPSTPLLSGGSAPLAAAAVRFFATDPLVWGSCAAWSKTCFQRLHMFLEEATCPGQLRSLAQRFSRNSTFLKKPLVNREYGDIVKYLHNTRTTIGLRSKDAALRSNASTEGNDCNKVIVKVSKNKNEIKFKSQKSAQRLWAQALLVSAEKQC